MPKKIILIDGTSLIYRAFFALPTTLATKTGQVTNAVYGFTSMLIRLLKDEKSDAILVALDKAAPTFRHKAFEDYKAHRPETPDELKSQIPLAREVLKVLKIPLFEMEGFEADDILATLAKKAENEGAEAVIVTGDRDALQLVSPNIKVMSTLRGITEMKTYDPDEVKERFELPPEKIPDMLGLKGDPSDNIPGVPGIGEKTAIKLIKQFGSLDEVLERIEEVPPRHQKALKKYGDQARLSKELTILKREVPLEVKDFDVYRVGRWDEAEVKALFTTLEFDTLWERLRTEEKPKVKLKKISLGKTQVLATLKDLTNLLPQLEKAKEVAFEFLVGPPSLFGQGIEAIALASQSAGGGLAYYFSLRENGELKDLAALKSFLESPNLKKITFDGKAKILELKKAGLSLKGLSFDLLIAAYLLDPTAKNYPLAELTANYLGFSAFGGATPKVIGTKKPAENLGEKALALLKLKKVLLERLKQKELLKLFEEVEMPLLFVLAKMEEEGIRIDTVYLENISKEMELSLENLETEIFKLAQEKFNLNSPKQLQEVLFEKLKLKTQKKIKTGYSTDFSSLMKLATAHPVIEKILSYRELSKLKSTYIEALPKLVDPKTGRVHTSFNQTVTATGRLSSSNPNLQNIPVKGEMGKRVREAFVPRRGFFLLVADYSQIELRILAHLSEDKNLLKSFARGEDIHQATAAEVFGVEKETVTSSERRTAKAVNFGLVYGMSAHGLSEQLNISQEEARTYIERYFKRYPRVKEFIEETVAQAYRDGYVRTLLGRLRELPELKNSNYQIKSFGERLAVNTPIQGSAADIIKVAMVRLDKKLEEGGFQTKMVLQVHDELVFEVPIREREKVISLITKAMEEAYPLRPKLKVDLFEGANWREAH